MQLKPIENSLEAAKNSGLTPRYDVVAEGGHQAMQFTAEEPKQITPLSAALGVGHKVDLIV